MLKLIGTGLLLLASSSQALRVRINDDWDGQRGLGEQIPGGGPSKGNCINHRDPDNLDMNMGYSEGVGCDQYAENRSWCDHSAAIKWGWPYWNSDHCCACRDDFEQVGFGRWNATNETRPDGDLSQVYNVVQIPGCEKGINHRDPENLDMNAGYDEGVGCDVYAENPSWCDKSFEKANNMPYWDPSHCCACQPNF